MTPMTDMTKKIRTRFAPSPTGFVHIGSLRTALFSFLFARHNGGQHVLRIEDTDQNRIVEGALENLLRVMKIAGIEFDEGFYLKDDDSVGERGDKGPYLQSKRLDLYQKYAKQLVDEGKAYYCFCTEQRLEDLRKEQTALKKPPMYDRHCRNLPEDEIHKQLAEFKAAGKNPVVRFAIPLEGQTIIRDIVYGDITYEHKVLDASVKQILDTALRYDAKVAGPIPLPTEIKKYTVNRSTFIYKDAREQFEMRIHKRVIDILDPTPKVIEALTNLSLPSGVTIDVKMA